MNDISSQAPASEIILVLDKLSGKLSGLQELLPDGSLRLLEDVASDQDSLCRFAQGENASEAFFRDFLTLSPEPLRYAFFRMTTPSPLRFLEALGNMLREPELYGGLIQEHMEPLERYLPLLPGAVRRRLGCLEWDQASILPVGIIRPTGAAQTLPSSGDGVLLGNLDIPGIREAWGIDLGKLPEAVLELLLHWQTTPLVWLYPKVHGVRFPLLARISLLRLASGAYTLTAHTIRSVDALPPVLGDRLGERDRVQLSLGGQLSRLLDLRNPQTGLEEPTLLGVDALTKEPRLLPRSRISLPKVFMNHELTPQERQRLLDGEHVRMRLTSRQGRSFEAGVYVLASSGRLQMDFRSQPTIRRLPGSILGVTLSREQKAELFRGGWIYLKGMTSAKGRLFNSYVRWKSPSGRLEFRLSPPSDQPPAMASEPFLDTESNLIPSQKE